MTTPYRISRCEREAQEYGLDPSVFHDTLSPEAQLRACEQADERARVRARYPVIMNAEDLEPEERPVPRWWGWVELAFMVFAAVAIVVLVWVQFQTWR